MISELKSGSSKEPAKARRKKRVLGTQPYGENVYYVRKQQGIHYMWRWAWGGEYQRQITEKLSEEPWADE